MYLFQFQYGAIKRDYELPDEIEMTAFQFHDGTIKSEMTAEINELLFSISIPRWYD